MLVVHMQGLASMAACTLAAYMVHTKGKQPGMLC